MEQSIKSEIDSIDKEIEALQKRKSQLQRASANETKSLDLDKLIESANARLIEALDNDYLKFAASKEGIVFEDELFELYLCDASGRKIMRHLSRASYTDNWIDRVIDNAESIYSIALVFIDSITYDSSYRDAISIKTTNENVIARVSLSEEDNLFDISVDDQLLSSTDQVIIGHNDCKDAWILVEGDNVKASFRCSIKAVEYKDIYNVLDNLDKAHAALTVYA